MWWWRGREMGSRCACLLIQLSGFGGWVATAHRATFRLAVHRRPRTGQMATARPGYVLAVRQLSD